MRTELPKDTAEQTSGCHERFSRRGKRYRLDVFIKSFPNKDPKKAGKVYEQKDKHSVMRTWVDEEGIESFSEGEERAVKRRAVVGDGSIILDDEQLRRRGWR